MFFSICACNCHQLMHPFFYVPMHYNSKILDTFLWFPSGIKKVLQKTNCSCVYALFAVMKISYYTSFISSYSAPTQNCHVPQMKKSVIHTQILLPNSSYLSNASSLSFQDNASQIIVTLFFLASFPVPLPYTVAIKTTSQVPLITSLTHIWKALLKHLRKK